MLEVKETRDTFLIATLNKSVQDLHVQMHPELFRPYDREAIAVAFEHFFRDENCYCFVAEINETPIGYLILMIRDIPPNAFILGARTAYIDQICVESGHRNSGAGMALMEHAEKFAKEKGASVIDLDHWSANEEAAKFFRRRGYGSRKERLGKELKMEN